MGRGHFSDGLVLGILAGVGLGLLFAPQTGAETRQKLRKWREENDDLIQQTKETTETLISRTKDAIEEGLDKLGKLVDEKRKDRKEHASEAYYGNTNEHGQEKETVVSGSIRTQKRVV